jgi:hypothetical protein
LYLRAKCHGARVGLGKQKCPEEQELVAAASARPELSVEGFVPCPRFALQRQPAWRINRFFEPERFLSESRARNRT